MLVDGDLSDWLLTIDAGIRFIGCVKSVDFDHRAFTLQPAFEYFVQIKVVQGAAPHREEFVVPVDMVGDVPVHARPLAFIWVRDLPEWRQREIKTLVEEGLKSAEAIGARKRSGLVIPG